MDEREKIENSIRVTNNIAQGIYDGNKCPYCDSIHIIFSFTHVKANDQYGLIISCQNCGERIHTRFDSRPPGFDTKYVLDEFQAIEENVVKTAKKIIRKIK